VTLPLYRQVSKPPQRDSNGHAGLWFDKFCDRWQTSGGTWSMSGDGNPKSEWLNTLTGGPVGVKDEIEEFALRMVRLVDSTRGKWVVLKAESRFVSGLGRSHPVENGFAWHPTLGIPYLPGSSVKGMVRAWASLDADPRPEQRIRDRIFGSRDVTGNICFMDALPIEPIRLEVDVMTPHYAGWTEREAPGDWRSPIPVPFLVTAPKTPFLFGIGPRNAGADLDLAQVQGWLGESLEQAGAGAKTAVGYGRFVLDEARTAELRKKLQEADRRREERIRRGREIREREEWLARLSPVERKIQKLIDSRADPNMPEATLIYGEISKARWSDEEKIEAARWLKSKMEATGKWKPTTKAKKPEKDKVYQRTLTVQRWLDSQ